MRQNFVNLRNLFLGLLFGVALMVPNIAFAGLGISPPTINVGDILPSSEITKEFFLVRSDADETIYLHIVAEGSGSKYLGYEPVLTLAKGEHKVPFDFVVKPRNAANGSYEIKLTFVKSDCPDKNCVKAQESNDAFGVGINLGVQGKVHFDVSNDVKKELEVKHVKIEHIEEMQQLPVTFMVNNTGNVDAAVDQIAIKIYQGETTNSLLKTVDVSSSEIPLVAAQNDENVTVMISPDLVVGKYTIVASFALGNELIYTSDPMNLRVLPKGSLALKAEITEFIIPPVEYAIGEMVPLEVTVLNSGESSVYGTLVLEIFKGKKLVDVIKSSEQFVPRLQKNIFREVYQVKSGGNYSVQAHFAYGPYKTEPSVQNFTVVGLDMVWTIAMIALITLAITLIVILVVYLLRSKSS